jgi:dolichol-phosphate mannosyltransferase
MKGMSALCTHHDAELDADALELAIVVPTFNEIESIDVLVSAVQAALEGHNYEIIIVDDDSPDGTADRVREIARRDRRVHCIQRIGRRGLSGAFIEGALATAAPIVAVIDGDMQHDEMLLPAMLKILRTRDLEVVVGSRYLEKVASETGRAVVSLSRNWRPR